MREGPLLSKNQRLDECNNENGELRIAVDCMDDIIAELRVEVAALSAEAHRLHRLYEARQGG